MFHFRLAREDELPQVAELLDDSFQDYSFLTYYVKRSKPVCFRSSVAFGQYKGVFSASNLFGRG